MKIPKAIQNLIDSFERLPGVGPKSAQRLTFYLLHVPQAELDKFASSLESLKKDTMFCTVCHMIGESDPCAICNDLEREESVLCVVEQPLDVLALEKSKRFKGKYHVLHGKIDPLNNIGPDEIFINQLFNRVRKSLETKQPIKEIILATNPTMEGEATAMYIAKNIKNKIGENTNIKITRIGRGLPIGADLEYADEITLQRAIEGRMEY